MNNSDVSFKIVILGDAAVGKSTLVVKYLMGTFKEDLKLTIGVDFHLKEIEQDGLKIKLNIWDFGGESRFRNLLPQYCKGTRLILFVYDITDYSSLEHLPDWLNIINQSVNNVPILLVGAKSDLDDIRAVSDSDRLSYMKKYELASSIEVSSKAGKNVEECFQMATKILLKNAYIIPA